MRTPVGQRPAPSAVRVCPQVRGRISARVSSDQPRGPRVISSVGLAVSPYTTHTNTARRRQQPPASPRRAGDSRLGKHEHGAARARETTTPDTKLLIGQPGHPPGTTGAGQPLTTTGRPRSVPLRHGLRQHPNAEATSTCRSPRSNISAAHIRLWRNASKSRLAATGLLSRACLPVDREDFDTPRSSHRTTQTTHSDSPYYRKIISSVVRTTRWFLPGGLLQASLRSIPLVSGIR